MSKNLALSAWVTTKGLSPLISPVAGSNRLKFIAPGSMVAHRSCTVGSAASASTWENGSSMV